MCYSTCSHSYSHPCAADWCSVTLMSITQRFLHECINSHTWIKSAQLWCFTRLNCQLPRHCPVRIQRAQDSIKNRIDGITVVMKWTASQIHANALRSYPQWPMLNTLCCQAKAVFRPVWKLTGLPSDLPCGVMLWIFQIGHQNARSSKCSDVCLVLLLEVFGGNCGRTLSDFPFHLFFLKGISFRNV